MLYRTIEIIDKENVHENMKRYVTEKFPSNMHEINNNEKQRTRR